MKCNSCDIEMKRVGFMTHWCGNCGSINSKRFGLGNVSPNLHVCATCKHWGPDGFGAALECNCKIGALAIAKHYTSSGYTCNNHDPRNLPIQLEVFNEMCRMSKCH